MSCHWRRRLRGYLPGMPLMRDSKVEKWLRWLETIKHEVISMHGQRDTYRTVARITQDHGQLPPSRFFDYLSMWYATSQGVAVRRQAEVSLVSMPC